MRKTIRGLSLTVLAATVLSAALAGCSAPVVYEPAEDAGAVECASIIVRISQQLDTLAGLERRETNSQGTAAWGEPAHILLRCGVPSPAPTATLPCVTAPDPDGVDWLRDDANDPNFVFTTYGRDPAIEVAIDADGDPDIDDDGVSGLQVLTELASIVAVSPATSKCISLEESMTP